MTSKKKTVISSPDLNVRLSELEKWTSQLVAEYDSLMARASSVDEWVLENEDKIRHERKMVGLLTTLMDYRDHRSEKLVKYISTFFKHLENKIKQKGMGVTSLNALIQSLDSADMKCAFDEILKDLEIPNKCEEDLIMMLGMVHPPENPHWMGDQALNDPPPQVPPNSPSTTERSLVEMMSYISVNDELDDQMKEVLQKVVKVAIHAQTSN